jgi:hypothetical protein
LVAIDDEGLFGEVVQRGGKEQWQIDRGLSMTTTGVFGSRNKRFWDDQNRVIRNQVIVQTTDEKVSKALSPERFHQLEEQGRIARDESGEFARGEEEEVAPAPPKRAQRAKRAARGKRLVARPTQTSTGVGAGTSASRSAAVGAGGGVGRTAGRSALRPRVETPDDPDQLQFQDDYHTVVPAYVNIGFGFHRKTPSEEARREIDRPGEAFGDEVHSHIAGVTIDKFNDHGGREEMVFHNSKATVEDLADLASAIHAEMVKDENYTLARVKMRLRADGTADVEVYRNQRPLSTVDVIRWEDANKIRPYRLYPDVRGRYQTEKSIKYWLEQAWDSAENADSHTDDQQLANPWVRVWRAEQV